MLLGRLVVGPNDALFHYRELVTKDYELSGVVDCDMCISLSSSIDFRFDLCEIWQLEQFGQDEPL